MVVSTLVGQLAAVGQLGSRGQKVLGIPVERVDVVEADRASEGVRQAIAATNAALMTTVIAASVTSASS